MLRLTPVVPVDGPALVSFLAGTTFPYHVIARHTQESALRSVDSGRFHRADSQGYWIDDDGTDGRQSTDGGRHGLVVLEDPQDETPMFDLRLAEESRGRGLGRAAVRALADLVFTTLPLARRLEGQTREDNIAMRRTLTAAGFVQEAFYRQGWPVGDGSFVGSVGYALLRDDWSTGTATPVRWDSV